MQRRTLTLAVALTLSAACASTPMPTEQLALADQAVESAADAGAAEYAAGELATARDKLQRARQGAESRSIDPVQVERLAVQAAADARLAEARADASKATKAVEDTEANLRALEEEAARGDASRVRQ